MSIIQNNALAFLGVDAGATGYTISRSLRFNSSDSAYLSRTAGTPTASGTWTFSVWVKRSKLGSDTAIFGGRSGGSATQVYFKSDNTIRWYENTADFSTTAVFRDVSSWYHFVFTKNGSSSCTIYVNGVQLQQNTASVPSTSAFNAGSAELFIGAIGLIPSGVGFYGDHYLTDAIFVDGQALDPTSFTEVSATTGQLIPKAYTGTYGTNGFHLPFSDNSTAAALGTDTSGNGNTWTVNNFVATAKDYNTLVSATGTGGVNSKSNAFDNDLNTFASSVTAGSSEGEVSLSFNFASIPVTVSSTVRVYFNAGGGANVRKARVNGGSYVNSNSSDYADFSLTGTLSTIDSTLGPAVGGGYSATIAAIDVDGVRLVSSPASNIDSLVDTPTSYGTDTGAGGEVRGNYATWNPLNNPAGSTFANGNLDCTTASGNKGRAVGTIAVSSGKWYWEVVQTGGSAAPVFGFTPASESDTTYPKFSYYGGLKSSDYFATYSSYGANFGTNDVIGVALDLDGGTCTFYKNGTSQGQAFSGLSGTFALAIADDSNSNTINVTLNAGQRPFAYTAPSGFKALCDTNLPAPVVAKPSTAMDVKLYTGNGSTQTISGLGFSPDFVWFKNRTVGRDHRLFDTVRGIEKELRSSATDAEATDANSVTAFTSDGFTVGSNTGINESSSAIVAWTWDAGTTTTTNTVGSITSSCRTNQSSGFSIVSYTGTGTSPVSVGHGLNVAPTFLIFKDRDSAVNWQVWTTAISSGGTILEGLNTTAAGSTPWTYISTTSSLIQFNSGNSAQTTNGKKFICYAWSPVAGYSSFGSYTGNGSTTDNTFVYTGMRPRFVMLKRSDSTGNWVIWDAVRNSYNVANSILLPNTSAAEYSPDAKIDILSNGFKVRDNSSDSGTNGATYIYAAFAESPFQYARAR